MPRISPKRLKEAEVRDGISLPSDYRAFAIACNGELKEYVPNHPSSVTGSVTAVRAGELRCVFMCSMFTVVEVDSSGQAILLPEMKYWDPNDLAAFLPTGSVFIGSGPPQYVIVLYHSGRRRGQVWVRVIDECSEDPSGDNGMYFCAKNFASFLASYKTDGSYEHLKSIDEK